MVLFLQGIAANDLREQNLRSKRFRAWRCDLSSSNELLILTIPFTAQLFTLVYGETVTLGICPKGFGV